jgi:endonuclease/exonuclease/phosphatase family metal-dependent hydrolase
VRIVSSNLQHGVPDPIGRPALKRATAPLRALGADLYGFQELDRGRWRTRFRHQGARLAGALDGELVWARAKHWLWASQANALVVRGEMVSREVLTLPGPGERRVAILATVVVGGERWSVGTTHLSLEPKVAALQLETTLDAMAERPAPHVLVGDLNLRPERVGPMAGAIGWTLLDGPDTINARTGLNRRLDHVLVHGAMVIDSGVQKLPVSDHLAVWADLAPC